MHNTNLFGDNHKKLHFYSAVKFANCFVISFHLIILMTILKQSQSFFNPIWMRKKRSRAFRDKHYQQQRLPSHCSLYMMTLTFMLGWRHWRNQNSPVTEVGSHSSVQATSYLYFQLMNLLSGLEMWFSQEKCHTQSSLP